MSIAIIYSRACLGMSAPLVTVEVHISRGLPKFNIVGLPETAVRESRDRVRSAIINSLFEFPARRITVNLAPADLPKEGTRFDLPIALGILAATQQIPSNELAQYEFTGELALSGELRPVHGMLPVAISTSQSGRILIFPNANSNEASLVQSAATLVASHLLEVCAHIKGNTKLSPPTKINAKAQQVPDMSEVKGQSHAKRALEIAAGGRHSMLMLGPPGTGKTLLANRLTGIMPPLTEEQALESATLASLTKQGFSIHQWCAIPFRSPHHTSSNAALVGGGRPPAPGEVSLAHYGILFLDELPEFSRHVLECLREPLESGHVTISRAAYQTVFPANFQLIAAMNPCPCGYAGTMDELCRCSHEQIKRYMSKISGPLLDRIDMHIQVTRVPPAILSGVTQEETSEHIRARVIKAHEFQFQRQGMYNANLRVADLERYCPIDPAAQTLLQQVMTKLNLSARSYHRIIKLARTIADFELNDLILAKHIAESVNFRCLDRARH